MNKDLFFEYVEKTRGCDAGLLDIAVGKGILRAKSDRLDLKKLFGLVAAGAVTAALCLAMNISPLRGAGLIYMLENSPVTQSSAEAVHGYVMDMADTIINSLGDG